LGEVKDVEGLARSVELDEVRGNDFNLPSRCVSAAVEAEHRDSRAILDGLTGLEEKRIELDGHLREIFTGLGYRWGAKP
jgi:type I restriction-modification system DNA methylase subunit